MIRHHDNITHVTLSIKIYLAVGNDEHIILATLSKDDDDGSKNVAIKMNLRSFKHNCVYLDPLNMSNAGDFSWS